MAKAHPAVAPLRELFGYSTALRSLSQGRASFTLHFSGYGEAPPDSMTCWNGQNPRPA